MHIEHKSSKKEEYWLVRLTQDDDEDHEVGSQKLEPLGQISTDELVLTFVDYDPESSWIQFALSDLETGQTEVFDFSLRFYRSFWESSAHDQRSGAYVFRPYYHETYWSDEFGQEQDPLNNYSKFQSARYFKGGPGSKTPPQMDFYFEKLDADSGDPYERAIIHVSIDPDYPVLRFDVDLDSLPEF